MLVRKLWATLIWASLTMLIMGLPGNYFPEVSTFWDWLSADKLIHLFVFGVQAFLLLIAFNAQYLSGKRRFIVSLLVSIITILYALLTEVLQAYVFIRRDGNLYDFIADVLGAIIGLLAYNLYYSYKKK